VLISSSATHCRRGRVEREFPALLSSDSGSDRKGDNLKEQERLHSRSRPRRPRKRQRRPEPNGSGPSQYTVYDKDLLLAKKERRRVKLTLSTNTYYTNEDGLCTAFVLVVDTYAVQFAVCGPGLTAGEPEGEIWIGKTFIVSAEIEKVRS
jgi:hypothetical protein